MKRWLTLIGLAVLLGAACAKPEPQTLKIGHVGHDHQSALYVAAQVPERTQKDCGIYLKEVEYKKHYELMKGNTKIADIELFVSGGGSKMPTLMTQGHFEVGFGGVAAIAQFVDKGAPMKIIAPLHTKGDMLVVTPDLPAGNWDEFVALVKEKKTPVRIGFKNPTAVAELIFMRALKETGLTYTFDQSKRGQDILMVHMKGEENLVPGIQNKIIDGFISNNPWCAIAENKGAGKCIADLNDLPPGIWKDHPCCCIAATDSAIANKARSIKEFLKLIILATQYANENRKLHAELASKWIGTTMAVEEKSLATSGFTTNPDAEWKAAMQVWLDEMNALGEIKDCLKGKKDAELETLLYDFSLLDQAARELKLETWH